MSLSRRPAGGPETSFSARPCSRLPRASASLGQSAAWAALAGHTIPGVFTTQVRAGSRFALAAWFTLTAEAAEAADGTRTLTLTLTPNRYEYS